MDYPFEAELELVTIRTAILDDLIGHAWRFAKLGLEGGELWALRGGQESIRRCKPFLLFERGFRSAAKYGYTPAEFFQLFEDLDYDVFDLFGDPLSEQVWWKPSQPWYSFAAARGGSDEDFVHNLFPDLLREFAQREMVDLA